MTENQTRKTMKIKAGIVPNRRKTNIDNKYKHAVSFGYRGISQRSAMDSALAKDGVFNTIKYMESSTLAESFAPEFLGYALLSNLMQNALIRAGVETLADEMLSGWIKISRNGNDDADETENNKIAELNQEFEKYNAKEALHKVAEYCGYFGGGLIFIDTGEKNEDLVNPLKLDPSTFGKDKLIRLVPIEPINIAPGNYNSSNPLQENYFKPDTWWVLGREVHASRFLYFAINEPPIILKPSYNFFGIPTAQLALDYCLHFTNDRESASRLLNKYSLTIFKTNMADILSGNSSRDNLDRRIQLLTTYRDNDSIETIDKEEEEIVQINTPIGGVTDIVRQGLELLAVVFRMPAVKLLGISPSGFNATGQSDMDNWHEHVLSQSKKTFKKPIDKLLKILQLNKYGEIDESITFDFNPLGRDDKQIEATINKTNADTDKIYVDMGAISNTEIRNKLSANSNSGYDIDPDETLEDEDISLGAEDKSFNENDVKRDNGGKFSKSDGDGNSTPKNEPADRKIQKKIDSINIDFSRDNTLPGLNQDTLDELGKSDKPVLLKKIIIDKNKDRHPDVKESEYKNIIGKSLYQPDGIIPANSDKPNYFNFISRVGDDKNSIVLLELAENKDNYEVVNLHWISDDGRKRKEKKS